MSKMTHRFGSMFRKNSYGRVKTNVLLITSIYDDVSVGCMNMLCVTILNKAAKQKYF